MTKDKTHLAYSAGYQDGWRHAYKGFSGVNTGRGTCKNQTAKLICKETKRECDEHDCPVRASWFESAYLSTGGNNDDIKQG